MDTTEHTETEVKSSKSVIGQKYRGLYRGEGDWLKQTIDAYAKGDEGVDKSALLNLAAANGIDASKHADKNPGMVAMNVGNMLRTIVKQRHGMYTFINGAKVFVDAPASYLTKVKAPESPTHDQAGNKLQVAKAAPDTGETEKPKRSRKKKEEAAAETTPEVEAA